MCVLSVTVVTAK